MKEKSIEELTINKNSENFIKKFEGYSFEEIKRALLVLSSRDKEIVSEYYGLNGQSRITMRALAEKHNITGSSVNLILKGSLRKMEEFLKNSNRDNLKVNYLFEMDFIGHRRINVERCLLKFSEKYRGIISHYYGLNEYRMLTKQELSDKYGVNIRDISALIEVSKSRILEYLKSGCGDEADFELRDIVIKYDIKDITSTLKDMKPLDKELLCLYYGIDGYRKHNLVELAAFRNIRPIDLYIELENLKKIFPQNIEKKILSNRIAEKKKEFKSRIYIKEYAKIEKALKFLSEKEWKIISLCYGLDGKNLVHKSVVKRDLFIDDIDYEINEIFKKINSYLVSIENKTKR